VDVAREFSPRLQRHGPACVVCDVSGLGRLLGEPASIGAEMAHSASAYGGGIRVAIAPTRTAALLLTRAHAGLTVVVQDVAAALAWLPLVHLQQLLADVEGTLLGGAAGAATRRGRDAARARHTRAFDMARRWGLTTLGDLAALAGPDLSARMGQEGVWIQEIARGIDPAPLVPDPDVPRFIERMELEWPIETLEPLSFVLARLLEPLSAALERADRGAAALRLELRLVDRAVYVRVLQLPAAMRDARVLRTLLMLDLESHPPPCAVDIVAIEIDPAPGRVLQYSLLERAVPSAEAVATLTARLGALVGDARCGSPVLLDTHRPDGFEMRRFTLSDGHRSVAAAVAGSEEREKTNVAASFQPSAFSKSLANSATTADSRALTAELFAGSEDPARHDRAGPPLQLSPVLRRFRPPVAVRVTIERGRPVQVAIDRRGMPGGAVERSAGPWRTSGAWWTAASGSCWDRDEWDIAFGDGTICRLFQQRDTGTWFIEGVLD
jgi:protein ImuB